MLPEEAIPASVTSTRDKVVLDLHARLSTLFPSRFHHDVVDLPSYEVQPTAASLLVLNPDLPGLGSVLPLVLASPTGTGTPPASVSSLPIGVTYFLLVPRVSPCLGRLIIWQMMSCAASSGPPP